MKKVIVILFILILGAIIYGFYTKNYIDVAQGERIIGISILATSFILMPLFIYHRWKGKDIRNYMLTKENLDKMNQKDDQKKSKKH
ncbi:hypothetical protein SAMN05216480_101380 [Pustulibacterium marinum]|uniref:Uncharacterized protein n=1 Tax=Pustulibacterium marinum TaxID=1224947 RepID=A0A1I7EX95_9FLAO|nr:hypothetical protein [Pustulibacterium marinum]SFU28568.1 hypothetical protein SAMN05216480_101380 [Pustulibacterium marinum]